MCTMTVIRTRDDVLRVAFNRDELTTRPAGIPPRVERFGEGWAILPRDSQAGGSWVGVNDAGVVLALLNVSGPDVSRASSSCPLRLGAGAKSPCHIAASRGLIIPQLLRCASATEAIEAMSGLPLREFAGFRLIAIDQGEVGQFIHNSRGNREILAPLNTALLFTSSGLGDHLVQHPRRKLFEAMLANRPTAAAQDAFHRHRWADQPHLSVNMLRADARTVSTTTIELTDQQVEMHYDDSRNRLHRLSLPLREAVLV